MEKTTTTFLLVVLMTLTLGQGSSIDDDGRSDREKRYIFINTQAPITLGFLLNMPISLALPTLANKGRSLNDIDMDMDDSPDFLYVEPAYQEPLSKLEVYFATLEVSSLSCQERLICELTANPEKFSPIGDILIRELRQSNGPVKMSPDNLMWRYMAAARHGFASTAEECGRTFPKCSLGAENIFNMPVLKVWQYLASKLNLQLQ
ncbi:uncharacterized protein LOC143030590 [Oratosquilla oratoria]|uniref:uncharacterized protein LOC143030590 n=1 Tax=Oratosquilla oratoria TaxID=337810 RepID=UPI003F75950D